MSKNMDRYGVVKIISGELKGRIGYYDDDDIIFPEGTIFNEEYDDGEVEKIGETVAVVYLGSFMLAMEHHSISYDCLEYASINDLIVRKDELLKLCSPYNIKIGNEYEELCSLFAELHFVETTLLNKIVEQRYMSRPSGAKIFISHSSIDKPFAKTLCLDLEANGYIPWLDDLDIKVGESIPEKISQGLQDANFVIVILSENSVSSRWVEREWQTMFWREVEKGQVNVLPVLLQDCNIPELLKTKKYADFRGDFNYGLRNLLSALEHLSK